MKLPSAREGRDGAAFVAVCALVALVVAPGAGCAPSRQRLVGPEARTAAMFFSSAADVSFPIRTSFSGIAELRGSTVPLVAGLSSRTASEETLGFYDPMGRAVLFLENDGGRISVIRGPAAEEFPPGNVRPVDAGPVSLGRILSGAPGYPVSGGETGRAADGGWVYAGRGQTLFSDPSRRLLSRAEYDISGKRVTVTYPGRDTPGPPR
ncbi:MAG: hypothetical protein OEM42_03825, partial [Deltaproteobacteria bacterium]|nr:hypothetical protein [Deltaproteobacteria bacterium]